MKTQTDFERSVCEQFDGEIYAVDKVYTLGHNEYTTRVREQTEDWITECLHDIDAMESIESLMEYGNVFWKCKHVPAVLKEILGPFRRKANGLASPPKKVAVIDYGKMTGDTVSLVKQIESEVGADRLILTCDLLDLDSGAKELESLGAHIEVNDSPLDVMASVSFRSRMLGQKCVLVSRPREVYQCLGGQVAAYNHETDEYIGEQAIKAAHNITPQQVVDWECLIKFGIDEDTASSWLNAYGDFWGVWSIRRMLAEGHRRVVEEFVKVYWEYRNSETLDRSIPVPVW